MEWLLIAFLMAALALGAGGVAAGWMSRRDRSLVEALSSDRAHDGRRLSLFDVFWDLGASDWALQVMARRGLIPRGPGELAQAHALLEDEIEAHGSYEGFIEVGLDAIQEFFREHREPGSRRRVATLTLTTRRLLAGSEGERAGAATANMVPYGGVSAPRSSPPLLPGGHSGPEGGSAPVDLDAIPAGNGVDLVRALLEGGVARGVEQWWQERRLRLLRDELDAEFRQLYERYAMAARARPDYYDSVYDLVARWDKECERLVALHARAPWRGERFSRGGRALVGLALETSRRVASEVRRNIDETIEHIHGLARQGEVEMAGYLLYLNHHAFFVGCAPDYVEHVERIERAAYRVRAELRQLR